MTALDHLLLFSAVSLFLVFLLGHHRFAGWFCTIFYAAQFALLMNLSVVGYGGDMVMSSLSFNVLGFAMSWSFDATSWFFAVITVGAALLASWYSAGVWGKKFSEGGGNLWLLHVALSLNVFCMLMLLASGDFLRRVAWTSIAASTPVRRRAPGASQSWRATSPARPAPTATPTATC